MANSAYDTELDIILDLRRADLGHPELPGLYHALRSDPNLTKRLRCRDHDHGDADCPKQMHLRELRTGNEVLYVACHQPRRGSTGAAAVVESDTHKALKERIAVAATRAGFGIDVEDRAVDGRRRTDVLIHGAGGHLLGAEAQVSMLGGPTVKRRSRVARDHGITPIWVTNDPYASLIDRAPWARIPALPPYAITVERNLLVQGGIRDFEPEKCDMTSPRVCPERGYGRCGNWHVGPDSLQVKLGVNLDDLIVAAAAKDMVDVPIGKSVSWMSAADRERFWDVTGGPLTVVEKKAAEAGSGEAETTGSDRPVDESCTYRQNAGVRSEPRTRRDSGAAVRVVAPRSEVERVAGVLGSTPLTTAEIAARSGVNWIAATNQHLARLAGRGRARRVGADQWTAC